MNKCAGEDQQQFTGQAWSQDRLRVKPRSNTSTVALLVLEGDEKGESSVWGYNWATLLLKRNIYIYIYKGPGSPGWGSIESEIVNMALSPA
jgi:hypothetical protein